VFRDDSLCVSHLFFTTIACTLQVWLNLSKETSQFDTLPMVATALKLQAAHCQSKDGGPKLKSLSLGNDVLNIAVLNISKRIGGHGPTERTFQTIFLTSVSLRCLWETFLWAAKKLAIAMSSAFTMKLN